jgi:hypothetical protein
VLQYHRPWGPKRVQGAIPAINIKIRRGDVWKIRKIITYTHKDTRSQAALFDAIDVANDTRANREAACGSKGLEEAPEE